MKSSSVGKYKYLNSIVYFYENDEVIKSIIEGNRMTLQVGEKLVYIKK